jgi:hypothetical protein
MAERAYEALRLLESAPPSRVVSFVRAVAYPMIELMEIHPSTAALAPDCRAALRLRGTVQLCDRC